MRRAPAVEIAIPGANEGPCSRAPFRPDLFPRRLGPASADESIFTTTGPDGDEAVEVMVGGDDGAGGGIWERCAVGPEFVLP